MFWFLWLCKALLKLLCYLLTLQCDSLQYTQCVWFHSPTHQPTHSPKTHTPNHQLTDPLTLSLTHLLTHPLAHSPTYSLTRCWLHWCRKISSWTTSHKLLNQFLSLFRCLCMASVSDVGWHSNVRYDLRSPKPDRHSKQTTAVHTVGRIKTQLNKRNMNQSGYWPDQ